jgi:flagellar basal body rod protein FlgB
MTATRNYKKEYAKFQSSLKSKKARAIRNKARTEATKLGIVSKGDGKDLHHSKGLNSKKTVVMSKSKNRGIKEKSRVTGSKRNYPKNRK